MNCVQPIKLILLDINMPIVDGLKTTRLMKERIDYYNKSCTTLVEERSKEG